MALRPWQRLAVRLAAVFLAVTLLTVGVVGGRSLADLRTMIHLDGVYLAGTGGIELDLHGRQITPPGLELALGPLDQLAGRLEAIAGRYTGAWLEQKPFGLTLHYRAVEPGRVNKLRLDTAAALAPWAGRVRVVAISRS